MRKKVCHGAFILTTTDLTVWSAKVILNGKLDPRNLFEIKNIINIFFGIKVPLINYKDVHTVYILEMTHSIKFFDNSK